MAEAEDVLTDVARHATAYAQGLWHRRRAARGGPRGVTLADVAPRLDLLVAAAFGRSFVLRVAQPPAAPTLLGRLMGRSGLPPRREALPATDGEHIWLPTSMGPRDETAVQRFRLQALRQAMRAQRGSACCLEPDAPPAVRDAYLLLEADAADNALATRLPGLREGLLALRAEALACRPELAKFRNGARVFEEQLRRMLASGLQDGAVGEPAQMMVNARALVAELSAQIDVRQPVLWRDAWSGEFRLPGASRSGPVADDGHDASDDTRPPRSARLARRPEVREALPDEDDEKQGAWMVQTAQPNEAAEDPMGLQRPTDRDQTTASEEFADALSELPEARLVTTPGRPKEVLLSDDPPDARARRAAQATAQAPSRSVAYPEWDWRSSSYTPAGATVLLRSAPPGDQGWIDRTLAARGAMLHDIRRRFELLRAEPTRLRRQLDGDAVDLEAWGDAVADFRAGLPLSQRLYETRRRARRDMAILLLVDVSGSTDGWIAADRRIIDVEREALLLVCLALDGMRDPFSVMAFSGEGPQAVVVREVKRFEEAYCDDVARRIAGLEPEHYTRAGAALRHATAMLMQQPASHRLLLLLSDGKPNDVDHYEGRYGVEDMRQAVTEARLQGVSPFCLTIDRHAASYLPAVFGAHQYALLPRPELLPVVLLDWLRRLVGS